MAQNVGIGVAAPSDKLHINAAGGVNPLLVQISSSNKLRVHANGGTAIGSSANPPADGLYVEGVTNPHGGIRSSTNPISIESNNDSVEIIAGSNRIVVAANGGIRIVTTGSSQPITIDAGNSDLVLKGNNISMKAAQYLRMEANKVLAQSTDSLSLQSNAGIAVMKGTLTSIQGIAQVKMNAPLILLNNGGAPAARVNDPVNCPAGGGIGNIISGSNTVLIGQ